MNKIEMPNVTRNEVITAVNILFAGKEVVRRHLVNDFQSWDPFCTTYVEFPCEAVDWKGRTLGKFDILTTNFNIVSRRGQVPVDQEFQDYSCYDYILSCLNHSCGVRNWFRDVDQLAVAQDIWPEHMAVPHRLPSDRGTGVTTREVLRVTPFIHEWYAMTRAFANPYFYDAYIMRTHMPFSEHALNAMVNYLWDTTDYPGFSTRR